MSDEALIAGRYRVTACDGVTARGDGAEHGIDVRDGTPVLIHPPAVSRVGIRFVEQEAIETAARIAAAIESPWILPVRCCAPRVVHAEAPPAARPEAKLAVPDAIGCFLQLCDVLARAHAAGWVGICTDVHDVRVHREGDVHCVTVVLPHLPPRGRFPHTASAWRPEPDVRGDLVTAVRFLDDLLSAHRPEPLHVWGQMMENLTRPALLPLGADGVRAVLERVLAGKDDADLPPDVASLAACVLPLAPPDQGWAARVASLPRVPRVSLRRDWDRMIELGEAELAAGGEPRDPYVTLPLAAAWHQRACAAHRAGDLGAALRDVERAIDLDPWPRYLVTRGVIRAALGDTAGAYADYDRAITASRSASPASDLDLDPTSAWQERETGAAEGARALYARGVARLRAGDAAGAGADLAEAVQLSGSLRRDEHWYRSPATNAALASLEDVARRALSTALKAQLRAGAADARTRWAYVENLHALGCREDALAEARRVLELFPDEALHRRKLERLFGAPPGDAGR